jgi:H+/Cl- antiporter ClcA
VNLSIKSSFLGNLNSLNPKFVFISKWFFISLLISILIGTASAGFLVSLEMITNLRESNHWVVIFLPIAGLFIGYSYYYYGKDIESGNNLLIETIHQPKGIIPLRMSIFVYLGTIITHLFGGSAGREGTALQMAGSIADQFSKPFQLSIEDRKLLIISAIAGGFGSVFGTPLAGAIFSLEFFLIGKIRYNAILPAFLTAILSDWITKLWNVPHTHYQINFIPNLIFENIIYTIFIGIICGFIALCFSKSMILMNKFIKNKIPFPPLRPFFMGIIIVALVFIFNAHKYIGLGIPTIINSFERQLPPYDFLFKMIFTVLTLSSGFKGGEVTPLFFIGATLGNALSYFIPLPIDLLAGIGFVAVFAGATNTPVACILMAVELFGSKCGVYVSIACVVSYLVSGHNSIYAKQIIGESKLKKLKKHIGKSIDNL